MAKINNLAKGDLKDIWKAIRDLQYATPLNGSAIGRKGLRVHSGGVITIENGGLNVTGSATISGTLNADGVINMRGEFTATGNVNLNGPTKINGVTDVTGELNVTGPTTLAGTLDITGDTMITGSLGIDGNTELTGNMDVIGGGKITVGNTILSPSASNGGVEFASGGGIGGNGGSVVMRGTANAGFMALANEVAAMFAGSTQLNLDPTGASLVGKLDVSGLLHSRGNFYAHATSTFSGPVVMPVLTTTGSAANLYVNDTGRIYKSTSASRFKDDQQLMELPDSLLAPVMKDWVDAASKRRLEDLEVSPRPFTYEEQLDYDGLSLRRIPGMIAEDVLAAGGDAFVTYTSDGQVEGFAYDRYALARTQLLAEQVRELRATMGRAGL